LIATAIRPDLPHKLGEHVANTGSVASYKGAQTIEYAEFSLPDDPSSVA